MGKNKLGEGEREHRLPSAPWQRFRDQKSGKKQCPDGVVFSFNVGSWNIVPHVIGKDRICAERLPFAISLTQNFGTDGHQTETMIR
ncbi:hypothetical protein ACRQ1B_12025 [Rhizobium panacihumi]|uniref:hypothetical protein n=1 Tax=Rhizobium panacihumi TaxID=2008450 RepID=UPI003D7B551C